MARATYTDKQREAALALYVEHGPAEAARQTGIARGTISQWAKRAGVTVTRASNVEAATKAAAAAIHAKRETLRVKLLERTLEILDRMNQPQQEFVGQFAIPVTYDQPNAADLNHFAKAISALIDKLRLEEGQATSRSEFRSLDQMDRELERLLEEEAAKKLGQSNGKPRERV